MAPSGPLGGSLGCIGQHPVHHPRRDPNISDAAFGERGLQDCRPEMGQPAGRGVPADIGNDLDSVCSEQIEKAHKLTRRVPEAPKLQCDAHPPGALNRRLQQVTPPSALASSSEGTETTSRPCVASRPAVEGK